MQQDVLPMRRARRLRFFVVIYAALAAACPCLLRGAPPPMRPTTVPAGWAPRYEGYVDDVNTMSRLLGINDEQRKRARDRFLLMSYELEQWDEREGKAARQLERAFLDSDSNADPKAKQVAFYAWNAALAPREKIRNEHLSWVDEHVLTAAQRDKWAAHELTLSVGFIEANGLMTATQSLRVRPLAVEVTAEFPGNYRDPRVCETRRRRLIDRIQNELLSVEQATRLEALLKLRKDAQTDYETAR